ncbi:hypothetical protein HMN09_00618700 [Mycena chlorophos]|uniref:S-formylglutathione hydrolase n=1 Tax=Mycena chlorophos TaxID=658473 RepID=A0A8H6WAE4_MYCCL|nr:hypothetical protein HMN09_00618700 [Mycena chlorophos]
MRVGLLLEARRRMSATLSQRLQALVDGTSSARPPRRETPEPEPAPASTSSQPILRWLGSWTPYRSGSPDLDTSSPPSPGLSSLNEALTEPIVFPPSAHLPEAFTGARALHRPPPFLDSLTRTTLPTASVSPPAIRTDNPFHDISSLHSIPPGSSVAALRSVSQRDHRRSQSLNDSPRVESTSLGRWWFQSENKDNVDTLLGEEDRAETVQQEQQLLQNKYRSTKNPVVFCHGLLGFDSVSIGPSIAPMQISHWWGIREVLESNGTEVLITKVPATSSPEDRAKVLEELISAAFPGRSVHLIGHSMGGLDCSRKFKVLSITTIATPHRGSSFADHFLTTVGAARMPSVLSLLELLPNGGGDGKAFQSLTLEAMRRFNEETPDVPDVKYFSWGATYQPGLIDTAQKGGFFEAAAAKGLAILFPDTSPRGAGVPGEDDDWDFGTGAGFYLNATAPSYAPYYNMQTHVTLELPQIIEAAGLPIDFTRQSIFGHSMGGHGALTLYLASTTKQYRSASAFAPICNPMKCQWGQKAFTGYLQGGIEEAKTLYDATELIKRHNEPVNILIDYGTSDNFYKQGQLLPENFVAAAEGKNVSMRAQEGYDHSYFFGFWYFLFF